MTLYKLKEGSEKHLKENGYWLDDYDNLPRFDGLIGRMIGDYAYNREYPHVGFSPINFDDIEIGISRDFLIED